MAKSAPIPTGGGNFGMGVVGATIGAVIVAIIWYFIAVNAVALRLLAWLPGIGAGFMALLMGRRPSHKLGIATAVIAGVVTVLTQLMVISGINDRRLTDLTTSAYSERMALAQKAVEAKTDEQIRQVMLEDNSDVMTLSQAVEKVTDAIQDKNGDAAIAKYRATKLPALIKFSKGDPSRTKFETEARAKFAENEDNLYQVSGIKLGLIVMWIISGVSSAFKIASGAKKA